MTRAPSAKETLPSAQHCFRLRLADLCEHLTNAGIRYTVASRDRTPEQQHALYQQGRSKPGKKVTNADSFRSAHVWRCACDLLLVDSKGKTLHARHPHWKRFGMLASACSLTWGGSWRKLVDSGHVEFPNWQARIDWPLAKPTPRVQ